MRATSHNGARIGRCGRKSKFEVKVFPLSEHVLLLPWGVVSVLVCIALISNFMPFESTQWRKVLQCALISNFMSSKKGAVRNLSTV